MLHFRLVLDSFHIKRRKFRNCLCYPLTCLAHKSLLASRDTILST